MKYNRKQLAELLNTNVNNIKMLDKRGTLKNRLFEYGYELINKKKKGRNIIYEIEPVKNELAVIKNNTYKYVFKVNEPEKFDSYFTYRTENTNIPLTLEDVAEECDICKRTVHNWDVSLLDNKIMAKDGFFYMYKDNETGEIRQITPEEYKNYWRDMNYIKELDNIQERYLNGEISLTELQILTAEVTNLKNAVDKGFVYRINKFKLYEDSLLYQDVIKMIER